VSDVPPAPLPRPLIAVAIGLAALLAIAVATVGLLLGNRANDAGNAAAQASAAGGDRTGPVVVPAAPAPAAASAECSTLLAALPAELPDGSDRLTRRQLAQPAPIAVAAWGNPQHDPVVLRCGIERPAELVPTSQTWQVNGGAQWLQLLGQGASTWVAVDRPVYVALTIPDGSGTGPLQDISTTVSTTLPATKINPGT
jgi:hypothetical protein